MIHTYYHLSPLKRCFSRRGAIQMFRRTKITAAKTGYRVGFIGMGNMGLPMVTNLAKNNNVSVVAYDTNKEACKFASDNGIEIAKSVVEIGMDAITGKYDAIFTMLPSCAAVDSVMGKLQEGLHTTDHFERSICFIDCSTVSPTTSRKWYEYWSSSNHCYFDAPVSGGVKGATSASLTFMVGHDKEHVNALKQVVEPLLSMMGQRIVVCGGPGAGSVTKLCNNLALAAQMVGICEAMNLGEALDVDPIVLAEVMNTSTAACWSSKVNNPHPVVANAMKDANGDEGPPASRSYKGGFGSKLMLKDLGLAVAVAEENNIALPLTANTKELYRLTTLHGHGDKDFGVILDFIKGSRK